MNLKKHNKESLKNIESPLDERLILKMDEESPLHLQPEVEAREITKTSAVKKDKRES